METILHLLPLTGAQKAAAPESEHLFLPTNDRGGASSIPQEWRERTTILLGYVPPDQLKTFPNLKWVQSWNAGVDPYLAPGVLPGGVRLTSARAVQSTALPRPALSSTAPGLIASSRALLIRPAVSGVWGRARATTSAWGSRPSSAPRP